MIDRMTEKTVRLLLEQKEPITTSVIANEIGVSRSSIKHNLGLCKEDTAEGRCPIEFHPR